MRRKFGKHVRKERCQGRRGIEVEGSVILVWEDGAMKGIN